MRPIMEGERKSCAARGKNMARGERSLRTKSNDGWADCDRGEKTRRADSPRQTASNTVEVRGLLPLGATGSIADVGIRFTQFGAIGGRVVRLVCDRIRCGTGCGYLAS